ncbi:hypothetical protein NBH00_18705 [Paraconexibacter antarcticus]|uniref:NurA domain-containing protein n=1 Tax=Paraconexibacter antarcticus TaxID=2949664 RepID=A0ABY5DPI6_9ACTN|nr:hypothetical protein [Paraconexibacter antarcticus]UTI63370.1 hypothetical protein NBH00_18705 [Paraconexibacter antarcticus]
MTDLFFEDWAASYGSPYLIGDDQPDGAAALAEQADGMRIAPAPCEPRPAAFVDGVRRGEGLLYRQSDDGALLRGTVGAYGCGAVLCSAGRVPVYGPIQTGRFVIFGGGVPVALPGVDGYQWEAIAIASTEPDAPLQELQTRMRMAEGNLAERLAADGWLAIVDGPLSFVRSRDLPVVGLVKTHHRPLLPPDQHRLVATLLCGERTPLFVLGTDRYSCYVRIAVPGPRSSPWHGIVRLELPQSAGIEVARKTVDEVTCVLPRYAGIAHRDPRAPQNLQPVGALEKQLRRRLGNARLASRAARIAVDRHHTQETA